MCSTCLTQQLTRGDLWTLAEGTNEGHNEQLPSQSLVREGIFVFEVPSNFSRISVADLERLKRDMLTRGRELAIPSNSADPELFTEDYLAFFPVINRARDKN